MNESKFLTPEEVTERYRGGISVGTLRNWRAIRVGPSFVKVGKAVLYPISDLDAWDERIESHAERQRGSPKISVIERDGRGRASSTYLSSRHHIPTIEMLSSFFSITYMIKRSVPQSANAAYMPMSNELYSCASPIKAGFSPTRPPAMGLRHRFDLPSEELEWPSATGAGNTEPLWP